jgi:flagellar basal body rod protein FlgG
LDVAIDEKGLIRQGGKDVAQLAIMDFENRQSLTKTGTTYFRYETPEIKPQPGAAKVQQGRLEAANFQPAEAAVRLTSVLRQFEMLQRAITLGAEMNRRAVEEVAKVRE